jgi:hypothetical protein
VHCWSSAARRALFTPLFTLVAAVGGGLVPYVGPVATTVRGAAQDGVAQDVKDVCEEDIGVPGL